MILINDDITNTELRHIAHGCNAQGVMGSGVALALKKKYYENYKRYTDLFDAFKFTEWPKSAILGKDYAFDIGDKVIHNLITQERYGKDGVKYARYIHIVNAIESMLMNHSIDKVAIPKIGCGLGGLDWNIVKEILLEFEERFDAEFYVYYND